MSRVWAVWTLFAEARSIGACFLSLLLGELRGWGDVWGGFTGDFQAESCVWISDYLGLQREAPGSSDQVSWRRWGWGEGAWMPDSGTRKQKILGDQDKYPWAP